MKEELDGWLKSLVQEPDAIENDNIILSLFKNFKTPELIKYVVNSGEYNINYTDSDGVTPLHVVCGGNATDATAKEIVNLLATEGANLDVVDSYGRTPLILSIETEKYLTAEELIYQGASIRRLKGSLISPLFLAVKISADRLAVKLIRSGADINEISNGKTPLSVAKDIRNEYLQGFLEGRGAIELYDESSDESINDVDDTWFI